MKVISTVNNKVHSITDIDRMIKEGTDILRINCSHYNKTIMNELLKYTKNQYKDLEYMLDLEGNKIRISNLAEEEMYIKNGDKVLVCLEKDYEDIKKLFQYEKVIPIYTYWKIDFLKIGKEEYISLKDGSIRLKIDNISPAILECTVLNNGVVRRRKGVNIPSVDRGEMLLTEKDTEDLLWGLSHGINIICLSYSTEKSIKRLKERIKSLIKDNSLTIKEEEIYVMAKIESREGVNEIKKILKYVDGVLLGRGDLYSEINLYDIPNVQKDIIKHTLKSKKEIFIGTFLLNNAVYTYRPSIPELNDINNLIDSKVSGFMLSTELAKSKEPHKIVALMKDIIKNKNDKLM